MTEFCSNCGVLTCGEMFIVIMKRKYHFCSCCFNKFQLVKTKQLNKLVKAKVITSPEKREIY